MNTKVKATLDQFCTGFVSKRFPFYPGSFSDDLFAKEVTIFDTRNDFAFVKNHMQSKDIKTVEVGVDGGNYSRRIVDALSPVLHYCVDPYEKYDHQHSHSWPQEKIDELYENLINNVFGKEIENGSVQIIKKMSKEGLQDIPAASVDFVYIDGNHWFEYVSEDLFNSLRIIKPNGIIAGHDFHGDVPAAVYQFCKKTNFKLAALALDTLKDNRVVPSYYLIAQDT